MSDRPTDTVIARADTTPRPRDDRGQEQPPPPRAPTTLSPIPHAMLSHSAFRLWGSLLPAASSFNPGALNEYNVGFDASWELDLWGKVRRQVEAADAQVD
jgi:hypothetical protein